MTQVQLIELSATLAGYIVEQSYLDYPYVDDGKGNVSYNNEAQDEFNMHYDTVFEILGTYIDVGQHVIVEEQVDETS